MGNRHSKHLDIEKGDDIVEPKAANSQPKCENIPLAEFSVYRGGLKFSTQPQNDDPESCFR